MGSLRENMMDVMQLCGLSEGTQGVYLAAVKGLAVHYDRRPDQISQEEVQEYLLYLIEDRGLAHSTYNCAVTAFRFFYQKVLGKTNVQLWIPRRREPQKLPDVLSFDELARLFAAATLPKHQALLMTMYAAGLRVSEAVNLRVTDIDSGRMMIHVREGKGRKDRFTVLSQRLLAVLREYWRIDRPRVWLFPGARPDQPMTAGSAMKMFTHTKEKAGITKPGGVHMLRHCFGTHMLEQGVDLRTIQGLMGHSSIQSTARYLRMVANRVQEDHSLLELVRMPEKGTAAAA